jgi:CDP-diacylglycerol--glycerol-3-phosphate 3-phosphatidyltransferase
MFVNSDKSNPGNLSPDATDRLQFNVPNALCAIRLAGSLVLIGVALVGRPLPFLGVFLFLAATDWVDGRLAVWLRQRTTFGARFDSVADAAMYGALLFGCIWLKGDVLRAESGWIAAALVCYSVSCASSLIKFGRLPSHHTYSAKMAWLLTVIAGASLLADWSIWPLRVAMVAASLANLESTLITIVSKQWKADVPTAWHATRR